MTLSAFLLFIPACFALNMAFGPNNLLSLTYGLQDGIRTAVMASSGRLVAFAFMITLTALGVGAVLAASEMAFTILKWVGAAYLIWLGIKILRGSAAVDAPTAASARRPLKALALQEFWTAIGNPKAILIFTAFLPQFIEPGAYWLSFAIVGTAFIALEVVAVFFYALLGHRLNRLSRNGKVFGWMNRLSGITMIGFGVALLLTRRPA
ncbi:LysE family translocator [Microvirga guangxiensis]|uniref:Threonine/homoserine/homoserine lactone efflux protein n=1 Tax=Microvirga guangxiensis TaxID=549386 RepID=A0A1G5DRR2_9HYPH|nr:LysE family translocator [Microvirga guangxiensis]SCY17439.1 Threonine/homoserine/homoserine lactone efflux protein [Microvirga guangxiensis]